MSQDSWRALGALQKPWFHVSLVPENAGIITKAIFVPDSNAFPALSCTLTMACRQGKCKMAQEDPGDGKNIETGNYLGR